MTQKQIDEARNTLPRGKKPYGLWTDDEKNLSEELSCREMINSCLCYDGIQSFWDECDWRIGDKSYAAPYIKKLGASRVRELVAEQTIDFERATIHLNVFTDDEGLTYNSIQWRDD